MAHGPTPPSSRPDANDPAFVAAQGYAPVSPLPRAAEVYVAPGSYGAAPHVPFKPYVPPLPPKLREAGPEPLRIVTEDPLAFLAAQAAAHPPASGPTAPDGRAPLRRFRPGGEASPDGPQRREARRGSIPPPGVR